MPPPANPEISYCSSDLSSELSDEDETKEDEDRVPLEQFATNEQFATTLELLQLPPAERSRENVECIFDLVRDNKFFAELDAEMSLELCRHMTYTTLKRDRVVFYKGDPADNWYLILAGKAGVYIEELKDVPERETTDQGDSSPKQGQAASEIPRERRVDKNSCVAVLGEGHSFGELGLIRNDVRSAALVTHSDSLFLTLDKKSFQHCLGNFLKQKTDDKVQTLRQVLPGAKELRKLVVEQLTYFFKEATLQKDVPLSTEGNKEDTLYLIVKGECVLRTRRRRYIGDFHSICAGTSEGQSAVTSISQVVSRALRQQRDKTVRDSSRPATAGNRTNTSPPPPGANIAWNQDRAVLPEPNISPGNATNSPASVLLEELDLALLQEGCIVNFCSLFFDSPEPFSVFAFSAKTQVFSISKSELFKHMPPSVLDAVRVTGLLLLQHLERRIGKQEERIRRLELLHQRDATQSSGDFASTENNGGAGEASTGTNGFLLPLTFSPFLSEQMGKYIDASSISLASHFDRFTRNLLCFQPHTAVLNHATFQLLQQQKQRRTQRHQAASSSTKGELGRPNAHEQEQASATPPRSPVPADSEGISAVPAPQAELPADTKGTPYCCLPKQQHSQGFHGTLAISQRPSEAKPIRVALHGEELHQGEPRPREAPTSSWGSSPGGASASFNIFRRRFANTRTRLAGEGTPTLTAGGAGASCSTKPADGSTSPELVGNADAHALAEAIAAREAAACAASALALGHPIVSDSALEFFFRNISRDAVNINNKFCCQYQSEAQVALQRAKHFQATKLEGAHPTKGHPQYDSHQEAQGSVTPRQQDSTVKQRGTVAVPPIKTLGAWPPPATQSLGQLLSPGGRNNMKERYAPATPSATPLRQRRVSVPSSGSKTARELPDVLVQQQRQHHQQLLARSAEVPYLHLLLQTPEAYRQKDRGVSLRGMAAAMQLFSASVQQSSGKSALQADICEVPRGASNYTSRRMLAQQVALRLQSQRTEGV